jgi:hypothetical protein
MSNPDKPYASGGIIEGHDDQDIIEMAAGHDWGPTLTAAQMRELGLGQDLLQQLNDGTFHVQPG